MGVEGELRVRAVRLCFPVNTGAAAPEPVWMRLRSTGDFATSLKCGFRQRLWLLPVFFPLTTATIKLKDCLSLGFFPLRFHSVLTPLRVLPVDILL